MSSDAHGHGHDSHVAHHFDSAEQQMESSTLGMWLFLITEVLFFGSFFIGYLVYRTWYPEAWVEGSSHLNKTLGMINTAILLCSSYAMAMAVHAAQTGNRKKIMLFLVLTMVLGSAFLGVKAFEYSHKFHEHLIPIPALGFAPHLNNPLVDVSKVQLFFGFYFAMTGMHGLHMVIGIAIMAVLVVMAQRNKFSPQYYAPVEIVGLYWHFVDIVWVFLFPLLYLLG